MKAHTFHFPEFSKKLGFLSILLNFHFPRKNENEKNVEFFHFIEFPFYREGTVEMKSNDLLLVLLVVVIKSFYW